MPLIKLKTLISAPRERVFDLARSIDAHMASTSQTREQAVEGRTSGLIEEGETVTWEATHFWVRQRLTVRITQMNPPFRFEDEMVSGAFASMSHQHLFDETQGHTEMTDLLEFRAPLGIFRRLAEGLFLTKYMVAFLTKRNQTLKELAETDAWKTVLTDPASQ